MTVYSGVAEGKQPLTLSWINVAFFATIHALAMLAPWCFSWSALGVMIFLHWLLGSIGICLGYHRMLTHRSLLLPKWLEYAIATLGALAIQGGPIFWVAGHRLHHAYTEDEDKDPYSARRGFWWSHMGWLIFKRDDMAEIPRFTKDIAGDPVYQILEKNMIFIQIALGVILLLLGGWSFVVWGIFVRVVFVYHCTWLVNSATHKFGYRSHESGDRSTNCWWVALLVFGEGWHNNHHHYPGAARQGFYWWEIDLTYYLLKALAHLGIIWDLKPVPVEIRNARHLRRQH